MRMAQVCRFFNSIDGGRQWNFVDVCNAAARKRNFADVHNAALPTI
jgi:hypothetical protein